MGNCPKCGTENPHRARFCMNCGESLISRTEYSITKEEKAKIEGFKQKMREYYHRYLLSMLITFFLAFFIGLFYSLGDFSFDEMYGDEKGRIALILFLILFIISIISECYYYLVYKKIRKQLEQGKV